jgi:antitoxin StbD
MVLNIMLNSVSFLRLVMSKVILADAVVSISDFEENPMAVLDAAQGFPVAVLNHNQPIFYCVPAAAYEALMDKLEDAELAQIVKKRIDDNNEMVDISVNEL